MKLDSGSNIGFRMLQVHGPDCTERNEIESVYFSKKRGLQGRGYF